MESYYNQNYNKEQIESILNIIQDGIKADFDYQRRYFNGRKVNIL
jgi:hypothetical protein